MVPATVALMIVGPAKFDEGDTTMAEGRSLTTREAVEGVLAGEHGDVLRESVAVMVREIMELEVAQLAGAELGERAPDLRRPIQRPKAEFGEPAFGHGHAGPP